MPKMSIDGQELVFEPGDSVMSVAQAHGISIPFFCWHPRLSVVAHCQMCVVEVLEMPELMPACGLECTDGMVVQTQSPRVQSARATVMKTVQLNHPVNCPVCDRAGECKLQDYYMEYTRETSSRASESLIPLRSAATPSPTQHPEVSSEREPPPAKNIAKHKAVAIGPHILFNEELCVNCTLCVRFMDEIASNPQLIQLGEGEDTAIGLSPGAQLDDPYSLNTVELCPVGALTSRDFRFKAKPWFLNSIRTVCNGCAQGCSIVADVYENEIQRYRAGDNKYINKGWLCDEGRLSYRDIHEPKTRIITPHARTENGRIVPISWGEASERLLEILEVHENRDVVNVSSCPPRHKRLALALSCHLTTEGMAAFMELGERVLNIDSYAVLGQGEGSADGLLKVADKNPNRAAAEYVFEGYGMYDEGPLGLCRLLAEERVETLLLVGAHDELLSDEGWLQAVRKSKTVVWASNWNPTCSEADLVLPLASFAEQDGTFINASGRIQRLNRVLKPINGRKSGVEAAIWTTESLRGNLDQWPVQNWLDAFRMFAHRMCCIEGLTPLALGSWGIDIEERRSSKRDAPVLPSNLIPR